jgi:predicted acetyltransferase
MPQLSLPVVSVQSSFLEAMDEFVAEGRLSDEDETMIAREAREFRAVWETEAGFADFVARLRADALPDSPRAAWLVPSTTFWWIAGDTYLGRLAIRHRLTETLFEVGGHIGYDVRPKARRQGHATAMLRAALPEAKALGIDPVLVTCDDDNIGSRKVIEANGGVLEDKRHGKRRYWVQTS